MSEAGVANLVGRWESFASSLRDGYEFGLDDFLNDVDVRQRIETELREASPEPDNALQARLAAADHAVRAATSATFPCVWGSENATAHGWTPAGNWWYFVIPLQRGGGFDDDLAALS